MNFIKVERIKEDFFGRIGSKNSSEDPGLTLNKSRFSNLRFKNRLSFQDQGYTKMFDLYVDGYSRVKNSPFRTFVSKSIKSLFEVSGRCVATHFEICIRLSCVFNHWTCPNQSKICFSELFVLKCSAMSLKMKQESFNVNQKAFSKGLV